ncbi:MAG: DUF4350 domain-containing protein [Vicingaceae bacterium]|nr:DUF4350 domain-containing protein [Vicingaceae bacterium]
MKKNTTYYIILGLLFVLAVLLQYNTPKPINWTENYSNSSKIPFGTYILNDLLSDLFPNQEIKETKIPIYNTINYQTNTNYIIINNTFAPDEYDTETIFNYVHEGNNLFVAARIFEGPFADSLKINTEGYYFFNVTSNDAEQVAYINFENPNLKQPNDYIFNKKFYNYYFTNFDTANAIVLGKSYQTITSNNLITKKNEGENINFIKINMGKGTIFINTLPNAFSNYFLTDTLNYSYPIYALSNLPNQPTFWDEYYKVGRKDASTPLRFILNEPALKFAYFLLIFSLLFYIIFKAKRKQRIIPVIEPISNSTTDFIGVVSSMYYQEKNHLNLAHKKINYFLEMVRSNYLIATEKLDETFIQNLALKSGVSVATTTVLIKKINAIKQLNNSFSEADLIHLNKLINTFNQTKTR